jgi:hypothetical protein
MSDTYEPGTIGLAWLGGWNSEPGDEPPDDMPAAYRAMWWTGRAERAEARFRALRMELDTPNGPAVAGKGVGL